MKSKVRRLGITVLEMLVLIVVITLVFLGVGFAQDPASTVTMVEAAKEASKWLEPDNLYYLFQIVVVIIGVAAPFLLKGWCALIKLAKDKSQNELVDQILDRTQVMMPGVVKAVYETYVKSLRKAGDDRKLTKDEIKMANSKAYEKVTSILGSSAIGMLTKNGVDLEKYVEGLAGVHVEHAKTMFKNGDSKN